MLYSSIINNTSHDEQLQILQLETMNRMCNAAAYAAYAALLLALVDASPQSNYADRGVDVEYQGNGIPQEATLDGIVTKLDELSHTISTNRFLTAHLDTFHCGQV